MEAQVTNIPWRARLPWFAVWVPMTLLLYTLINGAGHVHVAYVVLGPYNERSQECDFVLWVASHLCGSWGFLILPVLAIFAYVSWRLCPEWSVFVRWMSGMLGVLLCIFFLLAQAALLCPWGWWTGLPSPGDLGDLRVCAGQLWKPHLCRPILEPWDEESPSPPWKAHASEFTAFLQDGDAHVRKQAMKALVRLGAKSAAPRIVELLKKDDDRRTSYGASDALRDLGEKSVAPQIAEFLKDTDPDMRVRAMLLLGDLGEKSVAPRLIEFLNDPDRNMRRASAETLYRLDEKSAVPQITKLLGDPDPVVREEAVISLGNLGDKSVAPQLFKLLKDDPNFLGTVAPALRTLSGEKWPDDGDALMASARTWWEKHKDDPEWKPK